LRNHVTVVPAAAFSFVPPANVSGEATSREQATNAIRRILLMNDPPPFLLDRAIEYSRNPSSFSD